MIGLFSAVTLTTPRLTGWVLLGLFGPGDRPEPWLFRTKRAFCNHLCPIGGFTGLYAQAAPVEVRVQRPGNMRRAHREDLLPELPVGRVRDRAAR